MSIPVSTVPAVKLYLVDQLITALGAENDASIVVCYAEPGPDAPQDIVSVGNVQRTLETGGIVGSGGAGWLMERYTVDVVISVWRGGENFEVTEERAMAIVAVVESTVRSDPTLGGNVTEARPGQSALVSVWNEQHMGPITEATVHIDCLAPL